MSQKNLKVTYFNGIENDDSELVFDESKICEHCGIKGSYVVKNDPIVGLCYPQVLKQYTNVEEVKV